MTSPCPTSETCCLFVQAANWADCDLLLSGHAHKNTLSHLILGLEYFRWWLALSLVRYLSSLFHLYTKSLSIFTISIRYRDNWLSFQNIATLMTHWRWRGWCHCQPRWCNLVVGDFFPLWVRQLLPTPDFEPCLLISKSTEYFIGYSARRRLKCWYFVAFSPKHASTPFDTPLTQPSLSSSGAED